MSGVFECLLLFLLRSSSIRDTHLSLARGGSLGCVSLSGRRGRKDEQTTGKSDSLASTARYSIKQAMPRFSRFYRGLLQALFLRHLKDTLLFQRKKKQGPWPALSSRAKRETACPLAITGAKAIEVSTCKSRTLFIPSQSASQTAEGELPEGQERPLWSAPAGGALDAFLYQHAERTARTNGAGKCPFYTKSARSFPLLCKKKV